jgi:hypothetical protein
MKSRRQVIPLRQFNRWHVNVNPVAISLVLVPAFLVLLSEAIGKPPVITPSVELQHTAVDIGQPHTFRVTATGGGLSYQWRLDGDDLPGETTESLTFDAVEPSDEGDYTVEVRNADGAVVSESVRLWVVPPATDFVKGNYYDTSRRAPALFLSAASELRAPAAAIRCTASYTAVQVMRLVSRPRTTGFRDT